MFIRGHVCITLALVALAASLGACDRGGGRDSSTPSGFAVPRYVSLRFAEVNARAGPSEEHRTLWTYRAKGLPVQIVAETNEWRRICDPEGGLSWVHARLVDGARTVMRTKGQPLALTAKPQPGAAPVAWLQPRALAALDRCNDEGWCRITVGEKAGWAPSAEIWGTAPGPQCRWQGQGSKPAQSAAG